jgi:hypothetical protein
MLTKERCMSLLDDIAGYAHRANIGPNGINEINEDYNGLKKLIEEHFTPQPLKFEDFKRNMYVWDNEYKAIGKVDEVLTNCNCERLHIRYSNGGEIVDYTKNRFYPIIIPNIGDKSEKHI